MPELDDVLTDEANGSAVEGNQYEELKFKTVEIYESIKSWLWMVTSNKSRNSDMSYRLLSHLYVQERLQKGQVIIHCH